MSKKKTNKKAASGGWGYLVIFLVALVAILVLFLGPTIRDTFNGQHGATNVATAPFQPLYTNPNASIEDLEDAESEEYKGLQVTKVGSYTGLFVEDGSDDVVSRVLMIIVKNNGDKAV